MKLLLDTNIFIPLEPVSEIDIEGNTAPASELLRLSNEQGISIYFHPATEIDIDRDGDDVRKRTRKLLLGKYPILQNPPLITAQIEHELGCAPVNSNDWVDNCLLAAVQAEAVDFLVTEDRGLIRKSARIGLKERVLSIADGLILLRTLFDSVPPPPPFVSKIFSYELNDNDPIFDTLREDYSDFNNWLIKCKREHRASWVVPKEGGGYAAISIVKPELPPEIGLQGKTLKICTFKVDHEQSGYRIGELLLKTILNFAHKNSYEWLYVTIFEKHSQLLNLLEAFGFKPLERKTGLGEIILAKPMICENSYADELDPLSYHIRCGPFRVRLENVPAFIVPIVPQFHRMLFPELEHTRSLFEQMEPYGNSLRKAYLSGSRILNVASGANLLFYRSRGLSEIKTLGVVEETRRLFNAEEITRFVGNRTVYSYREIERLVANSNGVLAILFRQSLTLQNPIKLDELVGSGVIYGPPQSIAKVKDEGKPWLIRRIIG